MKYRLAALVLIFFAVVKVAADIFDIKSLSAAAAVTNLAPAMKVFTAHRGYETYSARFRLSVEFSDGEVEDLRLTPATYTGLRGPYNRRNVYGALIAYGPLLFTQPETRAMWTEMSHRAFCGDSRVIHELGLENRSGITRARIDYEEQVSRESSYPKSLEVTCE